MAHSTLVEGAGIHYAVSEVSCRGGFKEGGFVYLAPHAPTDALAVGDMVTLSGTDTQADGVPAQIADVKTGPDGRIRVLLLEQDGLGDLPDKKTPGAQIQKVAAPCCLLFCLDSCQLGVRR